MQCPEKAHLDFLRSIFKMTTPLVMACGKFGRIPLSIWIKRIVIYYWAKLVNAKETKLTKFIIQNTICYAVI